MNRGRSVGAVGAIVLSGALSLATLACGSSSGSGAVTLSSACSALTQKQIALSSCFGVADGQGAQAEARIKFLCETQANDEGVSAAALQACADAIVAPTNCRLSTGPVPTACAVLEQKGQGATGSACGRNSACASGSCNLSSSTCGTCEARIAVGGACSSSASSSDTCVNGSDCIGDRCVADGTVARGGSCQFTQNCAAGLACVGGFCGNLLAENASCTRSDACDGGLFCLDGKCTKRIAVGDDCEQASQLSGADFREVCVKGALCSPTSRKCVVPSYAPSGAACGFLEGALVLCATGSCESTGSGAATCVGPIADGQPCDESSSARRYCDIGARCVQGVCVLTRDVVCR